MHTWTRFVLVREPVKIVVGPRRNYTIQIPTHPVTHRVVAVHNRDQSRRPRKLNLRRKPRVCIISICSSRAVPQLHRRALAVATERNPPFKLLVATRRSPPTLDGIGAIGLGDARLGRRAEARGARSGGDLRCHFAGA